MKEVKTKHLHTYLEEEDVKAIKKKLVDKDMNIKDLANRFCVHWSYLYYMFQGKRPVTNEIKHKIINFLGLEEVGE